MIFTKSKMDRELDVLHNYKAVTSKIRRRFLKKPNFSEASDQFGTLTNVLERQECSSYAGFCCLAKARCENTLSNPTGETEALIKSARLFMVAELNDLESKCPAFEENLSESVHCFNQAVKAYKKQGSHPLAALTSLEVAMLLRKCSKLEESYEHFMRAAEIQRNFSVTDSFSSLLEAASCKINCKKFPAGLSLMNQVREDLQFTMSYDADCCTKTVNDAMAYCELNIILLVLILGQSVLASYSDLQNMFKLYGIVDTESPSYFDFETFALLQSLVMSYDINDLDSIKAIECDLLQIFDNDQKLLYNELIESFSMT